MMLSLSLCASWILDRRMGILFRDDNWYVGFQSFLYEEVSCSNGALAAGWLSPCCSFSCMILVSEQPFLFAKVNDTLVFHFELKAS